MNLAIDIGNTTINFGILDGGIVVLRFSLPASPRTTPEKCWTRLQGFLTPEMRIEGAIFCGVVPYLAETIKVFVDENLHLPLKEFTLNERMSITNKYSAPEQVGGDRLVNALAVSRLYTLPAIIVDLGTAITLDVVTVEGEYLGGVIAAGLGLSVEALHKKTALLPKVELLMPRRILGTDTISSMQSGITYGAAAAIKGLVEWLKSELGLEEAKTVITGGYTRILEPLLVEIASVIDENLTLKGLDIAYQLID